ncbi:hypothetical protein RHMOL_Rhmol10G0146100 [Rhododendron molle]|uniref:Uncharacterized protein n=1 Tax=Rhododendron molle TaxID=49168 RepID=A0ACC0M3B8_RHOML|nr:hypothetical protein RHMOL_Rhmol10G0146100 [Rhododendron molle]
MNSVEHWDIWKLIYNRLCIMMNLKSSLMLTPRNWSSSQGSQVRNLPGAPTSEDFWVPPLPSSGTSTWLKYRIILSTTFSTKTFNEVQKLLSKTNGKLVGDLMTPAPVVVRESTNLEDAARILLETKYRRLPVVDSEGKLVGIITRGNVVRAALQIKRSNETKA